MTNVLEGLWVVDKFSEICVFLSRKEIKVGSESELPYPQPSSMVIYRVCTPHPEILFEVNEPELISLE